MDWNHYRFHTVWELTAPPDAVFAALERPVDYPLWWPQVRSVVQLDEERGTARIRSFLPVGLTVTARAVRHDPVAGILEVRLGGDLEGWVRWTVTAGSGGARAVYDQTVEVRKPLMRRLAPLCRPLFRANHAAMMRAGRRGLEGRLRPGRSGPAGAGERGPGEI
ncbi:SRPBCC family protein [Streptomyces sp. CAU 1734]|uniref:SRPBCC family protein n=1 Tax=Streptomyces sp. CAU 1734 TaxID=3140360 RepID=UPI0032604A99